MSWWLGKIIMDTFEGKIFKKKGMEAGKLASRQYILNGKGTFASDCIVLGYKHRGACESVKEQNTPQRKTM